MALVGVGVQVIPLMGAAIFLPSAMATALRIHTPSSSERKIENDRETEAYWTPIKADDRTRLTIDFQKDSHDYWKKLWSQPPRHPSDDDYDGADDADDDSDDDDTPDRRRPFNNYVGSTESPRQRPIGSLDTWSVVWYCGMFAAFTSLFLIMPCSQVLCKAGLAAARRDPRLRPRPPLLAPASGHYGTPPPPYKQFAPPPYESLFDPGQAQPHPEKSGVFIIPLRPERLTVPPPEDAPPPAYSEASAAPASLAAAPLTATPLTATPLTATPLTATPLTAAVAAVAAAVVTPTHTGMSPSVA